MSNNTELEKFIKTMNRVILAMGINLFGLGLILGAALINAGLSIYIVLVLQLICLIVTVFVFPWN